MYSKNTQLKLEDKILNLFKSTYDDLIFEKRNKSYGAYQLRILNKFGLFTGTLLSISLTFLFFYGNLNFKKQIETPPKVRNFEVFDANIKLVPLELPEPPKGNPDAKKNDKPVKSNTINSANKTKEKENKKVDIKKIDTKAEEQRIQHQKDSLAKILADATQKRIEDSLAALANGTGKQGTTDGKGNGIDTTHYKPIGGPSEFGIWLSDLLRSKYTNELKQYKRKVTFTIGFNVNSDSTISDIKLYQKAYFGMDEIIVETIKNNPKKWAPYKNDRGEIIKSQNVKLPVILYPY